MAKKVEKQGKTVQEAVELALAELKVDISEVEIEVIDEGGKGFLGLGNKTAKVVVSLKTTDVLEEQDIAKEDTASQDVVESSDAEEFAGEYPDEIAVKFLLDVFNKMNIKVNFSVEVYDEEIMINISGEDVGVVIGRRGETLDSLQYLTNLAVNRKCEEFKRIVLDVENYREKRIDTLTKLANRMASQVVKTQKEVMLEPMNPYERRIIHSSLQSNNRVSTGSTGEEPNRCVVVRLK